MKAGLQVIPLRCLKHKNWLQSEMRVMMNQKKLEQYAREKSKGARFPPPVVFFDPEEVYWTADGFHRIGADEKNGRTEIEVDLRSGTLQDAILWNINANRESQGMAFSEADLTKSIKYLLTDPHFCQKSRAEIASIVGVGSARVSRIAMTMGLQKQTASRRKVVDPASVINLVIGQGLTHAETARRLGASRAHISYVLSRQAALSVYGPCPHCHGTGKVLAKSPEFERRLSEVE